MEYSYRDLIRNENAITVALCSIAFLVPFFFSHPQLVVGITVNIALSIAAFELPWKKALPVILLPSIGAFASGIVFGPLSIYLLYAIPFIWAGNATLVWCVKKLGTKALFYATLAKACVIFAGAIALYLLAVIPKPFIIAMGPLQALTAFLGLGSVIMIKRMKK
jgi:hypothetical protein